MYLELRIFDSPAVKTAKWNSCFAEGKKRTLKNAVCCQTIQTEFMRKFFIQLCEVSPHNNSLTSMGTRIILAYAVGKNKSTELDDSKTVGCI